MGVHITSSSIPIVTLFVKLTSLPLLRVYCYYNSHLYVNHNAKIGARKDLFVTFVWLKVPTFGAWGTNIISLERVNFSYNDTEGHGGNFAKWVKAVIQFDN
jgi:hypothetical protein